MNKKYKTCVSCVMDTTATEITFDENGVCSFCQYFDEHVKPILDRAHNCDYEKVLNDKIAAIKRAGENKPYDSILGLSGGLDSSYLAYLAAKYGLRPLVIHVDTGWNSKTANDNIERLVSCLGFKLERITIDWAEMRDLQLAFYKASVMNCEIPQDHAFLAVLYNLAAKHGIHYILSGGNFATESILPKSWGYNAGDSRHLIDIHRKYGNIPLKKYPILSFWDRYINYPYIKGIREIRLLNYIPYNRAEAKKTLAEKCGWQEYGYKHYESVLTRFFQGYYLPTKFGIDKRKAHISSMILSGQMTREEAVAELKKPPYQSNEQLNADKVFIAQKLGLSLDEWEEILNLPPRSHKDFASLEKIFEIKNKVVDILGIRRRRYKV